MCWDQIKRKMTPKEISLFLFGSYLSGLLLHWSARKRNINTLGGKTVDFINREFLYFLFFPSSEPTNVYMRDKWYQSCLSFALHARLVMLHFRDYAQLCSLGALCFTYYSFPGASKICTLYLCYLKQFQLIASCSSIKVISWLLIAVCLCLPTTAAIIKNHNLYLFTIHACVD